MPYKTNADLPDRVKSVLPEEAQTRWREIFNDTFEKTKNEVQSVATAWTVVKKGWKKDEKTGKWVKLTLFQLETFQPIGDVLYFEGTLLEPGTYQGLDGHEVTYSADFVKRMYEQLDEKPIVKVSHDQSKVHVGYVTGKVLDNNKLKVKGYIFDDEAITEIIEKRLTGLSMEASIVVEKGDAVSGVPDAIALVESPACPRCRVEGVKTVTMGIPEPGSSKTSNILQSSVSTDGTIQIQGGKKLTDTFELLKEYLAKPSQAEFFDYIAAELKKAGLPDDMASKAMAVIRDALKVPYPYPYPAPTKASEQLQTPNWEEATNPYKVKYEEVIKASQEVELGKLIADIKAIDNTFDEKVALAKLIDFEAKKSLLSAILTAVQTVKKSVTLGVPDTKGKVDAMAIKLFGKPLNQLLGESDKK